MNIIVNSPILLLRAVASSFMWFVMLSRICSSYNYA
jgi:hypothetical protein